MARKFRPLDESIAICSKMILLTEYSGEGDETYTDDKGQKLTVLDYWNKRLHGYQKLKSALPYMPKGLNTTSTVKKVEKL